MVSIFGKMAIQDAPYNPDLNTGTLFDMLTGRFVPGAFGSTVLNGGIASTQGVMGRPQVYKSTTLNGLVINALSRYPGSEYFILDTEGSLKDKSRIVCMSDFYLDDPSKRSTFLPSLEERIRITNISEHDLESFFEVVKQIADFKLKNINDFTVETPMIDPHTKKFRRMLIPTFVGIDSLTYARVKSVIDTLDKHSASASETQTVHMKNGLVKNKIMSQIPALAAKAGIYFMVTAQVGDKIEMSSFAPPSKEIQFMKQGEKPKGVGSDFLFLISNLFETRSAKVLMTPDKECMYPLPSGITSPTEMSQTTVVVTRCKTNNAGTQFHPVLSQKRGYEGMLTNYNYLRENDYFGMGSNKTNVRCALYPEKVTGRTRIAGDEGDYELRRSLEIVAQLCFVQNSWSVHDSAIPYDITPEALMEKLMGSGVNMSDIRNTRGWWTYDQELASERNYMSLFDILALATGNYRPKWLSVGGENAKVVGIPSKEPTAPSEVAAPLKTPAKKKAA